MSVKRHILKILLVVCAFFVLLIQGRAHAAIRDSLSDARMDSLAVLSAQKGDTSMALKYIGSIGDRLVKIIALNSCGEELLKQQRLEMALSFFQQAFHKNSMFYQRSLSGLPAQQSEYCWDFSCYKISYVYYQQKDYTHAEEYGVQGIYDRNFLSFMLYEQLDLLVNTLLAQGKKMEAFTLLDRFTERSGMHYLFKDRYKSLYTELTGSDKGWDAYLSYALNNVKIDVRKKVLNELAKMKKQVAPELVFYTKEGKPVRLSDYRGKIVVLDFWATWCAPCVQSFPSMQAAVNIFKEDKNVEFLFINTGEKGAGYQEKSANFLKEKGYDFKLLFDPLIHGNRQASNALDITAIPAKFVIDQQGVIRYHSLGVELYPDRFSYEMAYLIQQLKDEQEEVK